MAAGTGRTTPLQGCLGTPCLAPLTDEASVARPGCCGPKRAYLHGRGIPHHDVFTLGSGTRYSKAVTWCRSPLTGQELGRCRRIRSLYCVICVATLKRVRLSVEGWAWASAVWWRVGVRRA